ncbi:MAG: methyltransferase domain-containing protein [Planctomycetia bacterium]|jgi:malonyl-CoA O-methyltransferase
MMDKRAATRNFSQAATAYNTHASAQSLSADKLARLIQHQVDGPIDRVADLGCGTGMLSGHLFQMFPKAELTVVDLSSEMLTECCENLSKIPPLRPSDPAMQRVRTSRADIETETWGDHFSLIASNYSLQWTDPALSLPNLVSQLDRDGFFAFAVPCRGTFPELHAALHEVCKVDTHGLKYHSADSWIKMLRRVGLRVIKSDTFATVVPYADSAAALRSFGKMGTSFARHGDYQPLDRRQISELLQIYDKPSAGSDPCPFARVTYKTFLAICQRSKSSFYGRKRSEESKTEKAPLKK